MLKQNTLLCCVVVTIFCQTNSGYANTAVKTKCDAEKPQCTQSPQMNYVSDYTNAYKNIKMCFRVAYSKAIVDCDGQIYSSYKAKLIKGEDPNDSCKCMQKFILQSEWWNGAKVLCYQECDTVTLLIIGVPDKRFVNAKPVYADRPPIDVFVEVFERYGNAQVWGDKCFAKPGVNKAGYKHVLWTCDYCGDDLPEKDKLCEYIYNYANGNDGGMNIIGNTATHECTIKGDKFYLDVVAKKK